jgi:hypothetical protein
VFRKWQWNVQRGWCWVFSLHTKAQYVNKPIQLVNSLLESILFSVKKEVMDINVNDIIHSAASYIHGCNLKTKQEWTCGGFCKRWTVYCFLLNSHSQASQRNQLINHISVMTNFWKLLFLLKLLNWTGLNSFWNSCSLWIMTRNTHAHMCAHTCSVSFKNLVPFSTFWMWHLSHIYHHKLSSLICKSDRTTVPTIKILGLMFVILYYMFWSHKAHHQVVLHEYNCHWITNMDPY